MAHYHRHLFDMVIGIAEKYHFQICIIKRLGNNNLQGSSNDLKKLFSFQWRELKYPKPFFLYAADAEYHNYF